MMRICVHPGRREAAYDFPGLGLLALVVVAMAVTSGCRRGAATAADISARVEITPSPVREGMESVVVRLATLQGTPVRQAHVSIEGDMAHPGMAPVIGDASETAPGRYEAHIDFNMPGDWVVLEHIRLADGRRIELQVDAKGVRAGE